MVNASNEAAWREFWGNPDRRSNPYKSPAPAGVVYEKGYHRGEDLQALGSSDQIPALRSGPVVATYRLSKTGFSVAVDAGNGQYDIYCHLFENDAVKGGWVSSGDRVARMATASESPGTAWGGRHVHFVISDNPGGASSDYFDQDPRPIINATLASGGNSPNASEDLPMNVQLVLYAPSNSLILIDHLNRTMRNLGNSPSDPVRDYFSKKPYTVAVDAGSSVPAGGVVWQSLVGVSASNPNGIYRYI